jgi:hypothetical protein
LCFTESYFAFVLGFVFVSIATLYAVLLGFWVIYNILIGGFLVTWWVVFWESA